MLSFTPRDVMLRYSYDTADVAVQRPVPECRKQRHFVEGYSIPRPTKLNSFAPPSLNRNVCICTVEEAVLSAAYQTEFVRVPLTQSECVYLDR
ncbi:hypothetical protein ACLOJK_010242 [Asimina triloba]